MTPKRKSVSIIVPFYNEADGVGEFYKAICAPLNRLPDIRFEIICVDDGSRDGTLTQLLALAKEDSRIRVVELSRNFGKESALTAGLDVAEGDAVIPIDADLQHPPDLIPDMINAWQQGAEMVLARRTDRKADSLLRRKMTNLFYLLHNSISDIIIPSDVGDFRLLDRSVVEALKALPERQRFMKGLFAWVGFKTVTLDYSVASRAHGASRFSGWKLWNFALEGITSFSTAPLKLSTYIGAVGALCTLSYAAYVIAKTLIYGVEVPGYASILVAILFFGSVQLLSIGILGEYLGRIYMETKQRPNYIIRKQHPAQMEP